nr:hypothetical protein [Tanacetum cinerariifolium]
MPETCWIANLALQGGSGEGYGSLPTDFRVVESTKREEKGVQGFGREGVYTVYCVQYFKSGMTG